MPQDCHSCMAPKKKWKPPTEAESKGALVRSKPMHPLVLNSAGSGLYAAKHPPKGDDWLASTGGKDRKGQTLAQWRMGATRPGRCCSIYLVPLGDVGDLDITALEECVKRFYYGAECKCLPSVPHDKLLKKVTSRECHGYGMQILTTDCHKLLCNIKAKHSEAFVIMGFTLFDLYPRDEWNFVFGQANRGIGVGVFSFARYQCAPPQFLRRCMAVLCHEIGHLFSISHCVWWECIMNGSNHDQESDARPMHLCPMDLGKLVEAFGGKLDVLAREQALAEFFKAQGFAAIAEWHYAHATYLLDTPSASTKSK